MSIAKRFRFRKRGRYIVAIDRSRKYRDVCLYPDGLYNLDGGGGALEYSTIDATELPIELLDALFKYFAEHEPEASDA